MTYSVFRIFRYASNGNSTGFCRSPLLKVADFSYFFFVGGIAKCSLRLPRSSFQGNCLDDKDEKQHSESQCGKHINEKSQAQSQRPSPSEL
ncbi:hypothetical protein BVRB_5g113250 [Beta vulgaris subsp. vulgaris]|nr:hypothetical protein BVRB_5g113250 [Beta vulgaris subsp. vulgaris]